MVKTNPNINLATQAFGLGDGECYTERGTGYIIAQIYERTNRSLKNE
jgi:hypothetical protein